MATEPTIQQSADDEPTMADKKTAESTTENMSKQTVDQNNGIAMRLDYAEPSQVVSESEDPTDNTLNTQNLNSNLAKNYIDHVALFAQLNRPEVAFHGSVTQPLLFRDCLMALFDIVSSDYRYVPKDRTAYTTFMQMRRASANANLFASQRAYFDWLYNNDPMAYCILDPKVQT